MSHSAGETPTKIVREKAYLPLTCDGNGLQPKAQAPACPVVIVHDSPIWIAHWKSSPHHTVHCRACHDHFFAEQRTLL